VSQGQSCECSNPVPVQVSIPGAPGENGAPGAAGKSAFSIVQSSFVVPAIGSSVTVSIDDGSWMSVGGTVPQIVYVTDAGFFSVNSLAGSPPTSVGLTYLNYAGNTAAGNTIASGSVVSPAGTEPDFSGITALTDNTGGAATNTLAVGVGESIVSLFVNLADLANHDLLTAYTPGFAFKILAMDFAVEKAATTAAKLATLTPYINATPTTGGVVSLTSANCTPQGNVVAGTAVTAANVGTNADTISITGSAVTSFVEGSGWVLLRIKDMDTANAFASLASKVNAILAAT